MFWMCLSLAPECQRLISEDCRGLGEKQQGEEIAVLGRIVCEPEVTKVWVTQLPDGPTVLE